jgi:hypothetical protein
MLGTLTIGSNAIAKTSGVLIVEGKEQISLDYAGSSGQLLLNVELYDKGGERIAELHRNAWTFVKDADRYEFTTNPRSLRLVEKASGLVVFEANVNDKGAIEVPRAQFFTPSGTAIRVEPTYLQDRRHSDDWHIHRGQRRRHHDRRRWHRHRLRPDVTTRAPCRWMHLPPTMSLKAGFVMKLGPGGKFRRGHRTAPSQQLLTHDSDRFTVPTPVEGGARR